MKSYLLRNIDEVLTLQGASQKEARHVTEKDLSILKKASIAVQNGIITWVGEDKKTPTQFKKLKEISMKGKTVMPGFVESHTHLIFAGSRANEFEMRLGGKTYLEIAAAGGGILSTVKATREASSDKLYQLALKRAETFFNQGVTTLEAKCSYGLDLKNEIKCLRVLKKKFPLEIVPTFLGAHAKAPEFSSYAEYLEYLVLKVLPQIKQQKLSHRVDIYIEKGFFELSDSKKYLQAAKKMGFDLLIHADQLTLCGGTELGIELGALSVDHIININDEVVKKLAKSETTGVLLPSADLYMKCAYPPARKIIDQGGRVALATDFNPGTSPTQDLSLVGLLARLEMKMSLPEVIAAYTLGGAYALGLPKKIGSLELGKRADLISLNDSWSHLFYHAGKMPVDKIFKAEARSGT